MSQLQTEMTAADFLANKGNTVYHVMPYNFFTIERDKPENPIVHITAVKIKSCGAKQATFETYAGMSKTSVYLAHIGQNSTASWHLTLEAATEHALAKHGPVKLILRHAFIGDWKAYQADTPIDLN